MEMIQNSTYETNAPYFRWIGATYASVSTIFALICLPVLLIILFDKKLIGSFYFYSMHQLMADFLSLCSFGVYGGLSLIFRTNFGAFTQRFVSVVLEVSWHSKEWFMIFVSWTRFMVLRDRQVRSNSITIGNWTTKFKHYISCLIVWLSYTCLYSIYFFTQNSVYGLDFTVYAWRYLEGSLFIRFLKKYDLYHNLLTSVLLILINGASLMVVRLRLRETGLVKETVICTHIHVSKEVHGGRQVSLQSNRINNNRRREVKLFVQCLITCSIYLIGSLISFVLSFQEERHLAYEIFLYHCSILSLAECSIVYLILNADIRRSLMRFLA